MSCIIRDNQDMNDQCNSVRLSKRFWLMRQYYHYLRPLTGRPLAPLNTAMYIITTVTKEVVSASVCHLVGLSASLTITE